MIQIDKSFKPFDDRVMIKPHPIKEKTEGGILIPGNVAVEAEIGDVQEVGENVVNCKKGDVVLYAANAGYSVEVNKVKYKVVRMPQIEGSVE